VARVAPLLAPRRAATAGTLAGLLAGIVLVAGIGTARAAAPTPCPGEAIAPDQVITGEFGRDLEGSYVLLPFNVPAGTDAVRVKYCHDQPALTSDQNEHTLDIGLYESRDGPAGPWGEEEFRGWGGSSRKDVTISPEGTIDPDPPPVASEKTTVGFIPGALPAGEWAVELGVAAIAQETAVEDGQVDWRVEIDLIDDPAYSDEPYQPVPYDQAPASREPAWYAGDMHVHARHSAPGDATMRETFSYAFCPDPALGSLCDPPEAQPGANLDFITLSDYVSYRHWSEIGAFQGDYPGKLIVRSAEVITYRGHVNNHASLDFADYRTGPIYERHGDGSLSLVREGRPASEIFDEIHAAGGWTQINHPETFPSEIPTFGNFCRGCSWEYSRAETDYSKVDAIEVATGPAGLQQAPTKPGPNPFTPLAIQFWEDGIDAGGLNSNHIAAVGSSDSHNAGSSSPTQSPVGQATTVVYADQLSEQGIDQGVRAGHTYVKLWGNDGPDLRLQASVPGSGKPPAIIGDTIHGEEVDFTARVLNLDRAREARQGAYALFVYRDGESFRGPIPLTQDEETFDFSSAEPGRYRLQVERTVQGVRSIEAVSSPIYHEPASERCSAVLVGTDRGEVLVGTRRSDLIRGRDGDDTIRGRRGADCVHGGKGRDHARGGPGPDSIRGHPGSDELRGGRGNDEVEGDGGRDGLHGGRGDDLLNAVSGGPADERIRCGRGFDRVVANPGQPVSRDCERVVRV
jgi:hypothetical protein